MEYTKEIIKEKLSTDNRWVEKAIVVIYNRQTSTEQDNKFTSEKNGVGFTGYDANYLLKNKNNHLSGKHLEKAKKSIPKYWKQILSEIEMKNS